MSTEAADDARAIGVERFQDSLNASVKNFDGENGGQDIARRPVGRKTAKRAREEENLQKQSAMNRRPIADSIELQARIEE